MNDDVEDLIEMFATDGWKRVISDAEELKKVLEARAVYNSSTLEDLYFIRGRLAQLRQLTGLESTIRATDQERDNVHTI